MDILSASGICEMGGGAGSKGSHVWNDFQEGFDAMVFVNHHLGGGVSCDEVPESETSGLKLLSQQQSML